VKLKALESDYPCRCGHPEKEHGKHMGISVCWSCTATRRMMHRHEFKADNLRYLEALSGTKDTL
jgi:hypothetical protein